MGLTTSPIDWYVARASGVVAYLLLTVVVLVGLTMSGKVRLAQWPRFAVEDVHRFGGLLVGVFVSVHVLTIAIDGYVPFSLRQLVVPGAATYRPLWTALGIVAAELLLALAITNKLRRRLPYRFWRVAHMLNFAVWGASTAHGIAGGTDGRSAWLLTLYLASTTGVLVALTLRAGRGRLEPRRLAPAASAAAFAGVAAVAALALVPRDATGRAVVPTSSAPAAAQQQSGQDDSQVGSDGGYGHERDDDRGDWFDGR